MKLTNTIRKVYVFVILALLFEILLFLTFQQLRDILQGPTITNERVIGYVHYNQYPYYFDFFFFVALIIIPIVAAFVTRKLFKR